MKKKYYEKFCEILTTKQKKEAQILFENMQLTQINTLICIWEKSSSLLRWNNIKKELDYICINNPESLNILLLGLGYYVDQKTYKTHKSTNLSHILEDM